MIRRRCLVLLVLIGLALTGCSRETVGQGPSRRYGTLTQDCSEEYIVVFARGSSQPQDVSGQPETRRFFDAIDEVIRHEAKIGFISVEYPARGGHTGNWEAYRNQATSGSYHDSRAAGSEAAARLLNDRSAHCDGLEAGTKGRARQWFILGGYSQGAHVMREALFRLTDAARQRVLYVALFGDPTFRDSEIAAGSRQKGAQGVFGGPEQQVPADLVDNTESYCDGRDLFCGGGRELGALAASQAKDILLSAVGRQSAHALYPFEEMYEAAARYLRRRTVPFALPHIDINSGQFAGRYEGTAGCAWSGEVGYSEPGLMMYLTLDITPEGTDLSGTERVDRLTAVLTYEDTGRPRRKRLGQAQLAGTAREGGVDLKHQKWLSGGEGVTPLDVVAEASFRVTGEGPVGKAKKLAALATPLSGHQGCFYRLGDTVRTGR
ncbi:cutinase family protein [Streptomyces sp. NPDC058874]|uniref:cutinase family protein n=1 Tax=unclassified Streptomyces TaxID=2593676 RepID=UPI0036823EA5